MLPGTVKSRKVDYEQIVEDFELFAKSCHLPFILLEM